MDNQPDLSCIYWTDLPLSPTGCQLHLPHCDPCPERLHGTIAEAGDRWKDPLIITDRALQRTAILRDLLAGGDAFLLCGGPSANDLPLELLSRRGMWSMAVNNMAGHPKVRPQAFVCSDPPKKFSHSIWLDPGVMKFVPTPKLKRRRGSLRWKKDGELEPLGKSACDCPNAWGFQRHSWLYPDDRFFLSDGACWGNHQAGVEVTQQPKTVCTMFLGMRILHYLGARTIYLVGVDFRMSPERGYSFGQGRDKGASASNNHLFEVVNDWLCQMQEGGVFQRFGLSIYNCYERSGLRAFSHVPFEDAVQHARGAIEESPDLSGWYDPEVKP